MNNAEFSSGMGRLRDYFGDKAYTPKVETIIWRLVSAISRAEFEQVIEALVEEHQRPPTPALIKRAALPYIRKAEEAKRAAMVKGISSEASCRICGNSGHMLALLRSSPDKEFSFRCGYCRAGEMLRLNGILPWSDDFKDRYIPVSLKLDSFSAARELQNKHLRPEIVRSWAKRLVTHPWALASLRRAMGGAAALVTTWLTEAGLGHLTKRKEERVESEG